MRSPVGDDIFPRARYFPATGPNHNRWLRSSEIDFGNGFVGRIIARRAPDGRIEFGFRVEGYENEDFFPRARYFPVDGPDHHRWLRSSEIAISRPSSGEPDFAALGAQGDANPSAPDDPSRAAKKDLLVATLYGYSQSAEANSKTYHDYNDFGCPLSAYVDPFGGKPLRNNCDNWPSSEWNIYYPRHWQWIVENDQGQQVAVPGYIEGHSGWDVQTKTKGNEPFYSLTNGTVKAVDDLSNDKNEYGIIAIKDEAGNTIVYLHASAIDSRIQPNAPVSIGDCLGRQGETGVEWSSPHLHIEVRSGAAKGGSGGAYWISPPSQRPQSPGIDPVGYLYSIVSDSNAQPKPCDFEVSPDRGAEPVNDDASVPEPPIASLRDLSSGDLIQQHGSGETYVVKQEEGRWFRRHVVAYALYAAVPGWDEDSVKTVNAATFSQIRHSPLVNIPSSETAIYVVEETGEDDIVLRHIPNPTAFRNAGCDWQGVFSMSSGEYQHWESRAESQNRELFGGAIGSSYRCP